MKTPVQLIDLKSAFPPPTGEDWRQAAEALLKGAPFEKVLQTDTPENIILEPIYTADDATPFVETLPGQPPYLRGIYAGGYLTHPWHVAQNLFESDPKSFNQAIKKSLKTGQDTIFLTIGGKDGVNIKSLNDLRTALKGIDLTRYPVMIDCGEYGMTILPVFTSFCEAEKIEPGKIALSILFDPFKTALSTGKMESSLHYLMKPIAESLKWCETHAPNWRILAMDASQYTDAGASAVQELAWSLATAVEMIRGLMDFDLDFNGIARRLHFRFGLGNHFFMEIAKFRAARLLWNQIASAFGGDRDSAKMNIHARTILLNKSWLDPHVNLLRTTTEALSGVLGGIDSLEVDPFDRVYDLPDELSKRIARNIHIILREETHLDRIIDPAGGSWYVEWLTEQIAHKSWQLFQDVEGQGGMYKALCNGTIQQQAADTLNKREEHTARRKDRLVGVNMYANEQEKLNYPKGEYSEPDESSGDLPHSDKLKELLATATDPLTTLIAKAGEFNLAQIRVSWPEQNELIEIKPLQFRRLAEPYEKLRLAVDRYNQSHTESLSALLITFGSVAQYKAREDFSAAFFRAAGFQIISSGALTDLSGARQEIEKIKAPLIVFCSSDERYPEFVPELAEQIKEKYPDKMIVLAGYPKEHLESFRQAGVDEFIHLRCNALEVLKSLLTRLEVPA